MPLIRIPYDEHLTKHFIILYVQDSLTEDQLCAFKTTFCLLSCTQLILLVGVQNFDGLPVVAAHFLRLLSLLHILRLRHARSYDTTALALKQYASKYGLNNAHVGYFLTFSYFIYLFQMSSEKYRSANVVMVIIIQVLLFISALN